MQHIDLSVLEEIERRCEVALKEYPEERRKLHERLRARLEKELFAAIGASGFSDGGKALRNWQESDVGTGGGYAAVRAKPGRGASGKHADSPGAITNYNENGHRVRPPSGSAQRAQRGRAKMLFVPGRGFYARTGMQVATILENEAQLFLQKMAAKVAD